MKIWPDMWCICGWERICEILEVVHLWIHNFRCRNFQRILQCCKILHFFTNWLIHKSLEQHIGSSWKFYRDVFKHASPDYILKLPYPVSILDSPWQLAHFCALLSALFLRCDVFLAGSMRTCKVHGPISITAGSKIRLPVYVRKNSLL